MSTAMSDAELRALRSPRVTRPLRGVAYAEAAVEAPVSAARGLGRLASRALSVPLGWGVEAAVGLLTPQQRRKMRRMGGIAS